MRPKSAGCGSLSECITHLGARCPLTGHTVEAAESVRRFVFPEKMVESGCRMSVVS